MSAIAGIYYLDGRTVERADLKRMVDILAHRGPDGSDIWCEGSVGLAHRMLWTTPESLLEQLPLANQTGLVITADARIDNREELICALALSDRPAEKITDSQLILAAYEKWGESCPEKLLGDFAFVIWDQRKQSLFCTRDHFGVKPFYYYRSGQTFIFASEIKALLCLPEVPKQLNEVKIADYLTSMMEDKSTTLYQGILRLPPAHIMIVKYAQSIYSKKYWQLNPSHEIQLNSDEEYAEAFREIFTEAVRCRLRSAFPIGSHLSGGLDSSSVTCTARELLAKSTGSPLHTFSNVFDQVTECDERRYIETVLEQGNLISHYIHPEQLGPLSDWQQFFQYEDEPFIGPSHFLVWGLNCATQQQGVRVALDGFDGDSTVSHGVLYFTELACKGQWDTFATEANAVSHHFDTSLSAILHHYGYTYLEKLARERRVVTFAKAANELCEYFQVSRKHVFLHHGLKFLVPQSLQQFLKSLYGQKNNLNNSNTSLINPSFAQRLTMYERNFDMPRSPPLTVREDQLQMFNSGVFTLTLELVDRSAAACSIESRHPFMDKRLIEFCLALPPQQKLNQGWSRIVLRRAMNNILPKEIQWRGGKTNMTPNFIHGLLRHNRELLDKVILNDFGSITTYVDLNTLHRSYDQLTSGGKIKDEDIMTVWRAATLALWLRYSGITP